MILSLMSNSRHTDGWGSILVTLIASSVWLALLAFTFTAEDSSESQLYSFYHLPRSLSDDAWNKIHMCASWRFISHQHWDHTGLPSGIWCLKWLKWLIRKRIQASCHTLKCPQHTLKVLSHYSHPHAFIIALVFQDKTPTRQDHPPKLFFSINHFSLKCHCTGWMLKIRTSPDPVQGLCNFWHLVLLPLTLKFPFTLRFYGSPSGSPPCRHVEIFEKLAAAHPKPAILSEAAHI